MRWGRSESGSRRPMTEGFLVVDKPPGRTSHDVVAEVRKAVGMRKVGHAGTLDPMATGVVVVALGRCTRLIRFIQDQPKEYVATARFGVATDTLDADGQVLEEMDMDVDVAALREIAARSFSGEIMQVPPMVSALKKDGKRLYELAREGIEVERDPRPVVVHELEIVSVTPGEHPEVDFRVVCGKGTYVRSLADDLARELGGRAHLTSLRRTTTGGASVHDAVRLEDLDAWSEFLLGPNEVLSDRPEVVVDQETADRLKNGIRFEAPELPPEPFRVVDPDGRFVAICEAEDGVAIPIVVFN